MARAPSSLINEIQSIYPYLKELRSNVIGKCKKDRQELICLEKKYKSLVDLVPNYPMEGVPIGEDENSNFVVKTWGEIPKFDFPVRSHKEIGKFNNAMDFDCASKISGSRFALLSGSLARFERALGSFMLDVAVKNGYVEVSPPLMVNDSALYNTGQLPKFEDDLFCSSGHYLVPTAEVPLTNMVANSLLNKEDLPLRYTACTPCFRKEAGSAGKDTSGMIRLHQFNKVELVSITTQEQSADEHERMTCIAESILEKFGLPYRRVLLCDGDMGFSAAKTYDIEVWMPSQNMYREISSCSNCTDFQSKRMKTKYIDCGQKKFVHTLNGSSLAIGRLIAALLENFQKADGSFDILDLTSKYFFNL